MGVITLTYTFANGATADAPQVNSNFNTIVSEINGNLDDANIKSGAGIATSKISGTAVNLSSDQTLTGKKTLAGTNQTITTASDGATVTFNLGLGNMHQVTLGGNRTLALSNATTGQVFFIKLIQDGSGSRTVTWFSGITWRGNSGSAPTLSTAANDVDTFMFICTGSGAYDGFIVSQD